MDHKPAGVKRRNGIHCRRTQRLTKRLSWAVSLLAPDCLAEAQRSGITSRSFHLVVNQKIFLALEAMQRDGTGMTSQH